MLSATAASELDTEDCGRKIFLVYTEWFALSEDTTTAIIAEAHTSPGMTDRG
jgi:hypothetical protein